MIIFNIGFFRFTFFIPNKKLNRISKNGLREHVFKEIFKLKMQFKKFRFFYHFNPDWLPNISFWFDHYY